VSTKFNGQILVEIAQTPTERHRWLSFPSAPKFHRILLRIPRTTMYCSGMALRETNPSFMNGVPELLILTLLQQGEMYGYELVQAIRDRTGASIALGEGVVYPVLHNLERDGALTAQRKPVNGRSRIYYSLTPTGSRRLSNLAATWTSLTNSIQLVLTGHQSGGHHAPALP
jgi:PadR family transcriptional regulator, regulatory protein PadR